MVHLPTMDRMRELYESNLELWLSEHPGEFVLIEDGETCNDISVSFYATEGELEKATSTYKDLYGPTFFTGKIPEKTHRFNKGNTRLMTTNQYVKYCPNDPDQYAPLPNGVVEFTSTPEGKRYSEFTRCPDCGCQVFRKPTDERIKETEERMKKLRFK